MVATDLVPGYLHGVSNGLRIVANVFLAGALEGDAGADNGYKHPNLVSVLTYLVHRPVDLGARRPRDHVRPSLKEQRNAVGKAVNRDPL